MTKFEFDHLVRVIRAYSCVWVSEDEIRARLFAQILAERRR